MTRKAFTSDRTPPPAGSYNVAVEAAGLVFLAGQTPRDRDNVRHGDKPFAVQARMALDNLEAAANAAGLSLKDAVRVGVFLRSPANASEFDAIYKEYVSEPLPARTLSQSCLEGFDIEVDAVLVRAPRPTS
jgi:enamine deaminase RidA (YjgF/YER057c/UK114 family)